LKWVTILDLFRAASIPLFQDAAKAILVILDFGLPIKPKIKVTPWYLPTSLS
jgi:hypothetical protein